MKEKNLYQEMTALERQTGRSRYELAVSQMRTLECAQQFIQEGARALEDSQKGITYEMGIWNIAEKVLQYVGHNDREGEELWADAGVAAATSSVGGFLVLSE